MSLTLQNEFFQFVAASIVALLIYKTAATSEGIISLSHFLRKWGLIWASSLYCFLHFGDRWYK